jgi:hypothetical protein
VRAAKMTTPSAARQRAKAMRKGRLDAKGGCGD